MPASIVDIFFFQQCFLANWLLIILLTIILIVNKPFHLKLN